MSLCLQNPFASDTWSVSWFATLTRGFFISQYFWMYGTVAAPLASDIATSIFLGKVSRMLNPRPTVNAYVQGTCRLTDLLGLARW